MDSGAQAKVIIDSSLAPAVAQALGTKVHRLPTPQSVKGFDGRRGRDITHYLEAHLHVDMRREHDVTILVADLGSTDMIIGLKWMHEYEATVAMCNEYYWPRNVLNNLVIL